MDLQDLGTQWGLMASCGLILCIWWIAKEGGD